MTAGTSCFPSGYGRYVSRFFYLSGGWVMSDI